MILLDYKKTAKKVSSVKISLQFVRLLCALAEAAILAFQGKSHKGDIVSNNLSPDYAARRGENALNTL